MKRIFLIAALYALPTASFAAIDTDGLVAGYQADGYTAIEVTRGPNQTKVEAVRGGSKVEVVYDNATGAALKSEHDTAEADDDIKPGVSVRDRNRDFTGDDDSADDNGSDDNGSDDSGSDDNGDDDNGNGNGGDDGSGHGSDDHGGDDNGGSGHGSDGHGGDDHGGDDHGSDHD